MRSASRSGREYPELEREDLLAALEFGALASGSRRVTPLDEASFVELGHDRLVVRGDR